MAEQQQQQPTVAQVMAELARVNARLDQQQGGDAARCSAQASEAAPPGPPGPGDVQWYQPSDVSAIQDQTAG